MKPTDYREEAAQIYLARQRKIQEAKDFQKFKALLLIFMAVAAACIWIISRH